MMRSFYALHARNKEEETTLKNLSRINIFNWMEDNIKMDCS